MEKKFKTFEEYKLELNEVKAKEIDKKFLKMKWEHYTPTSEWSDMLAKYFNFKSFTTFKSGEQFEGGSSMVLGIDDKKTYLIAIMQGGFLGKKELNNNKILFKQEFKAEKEFYKFAEQFIPEKELKKYL